MLPRPPPPAAVHVRLAREGAVFEDERRGAYLRLDAEGRWVAWRERGALMRRTLLGAVHVGPRPGIVLAPGPARAAHGRVLAAVGAWRTRLRAGGLASEAAPPPGLLALLQRASDLTVAAYERHAATARSEYAEGIPILPPHRQRDLVVTPARGCPNGRCTFCAFYRERPFRVLDRADFARHLDAVAALCGADAAVRRGVFLGSASAASLGDARLLEVLAAVERRLGRRPRGVAAFLDPDHAPARTARGWGRLAAAGLGDLTLGLETGLASLRAAAGKGADLGAFGRTVAALKEAGVRVALTVLVGLGGAPAERAHRDATVAYLGGLGLGPGDRVYLCELDEAAGGPRRRAALAPWHDALGAVTSATVAPYPAADFVAWA